MGRVSRRRKSSSDVREWGRDLPRRGARRGPVRFGCDAGECQGRPGGFKQRGPRSSSAPPTREGRPQAVGSEAEGRGALPLGTSPVGAPAAHPAPLPRGCGVSRRAQPPATSYRLAAAPGAPSAPHALPAPHHSSERDGFPGKRAAGGGHGVGRTRAALRRAGRGTPGTRQAGRGGGEKGPSFLAPGRRPSAITGAAVEGGPGVPAAPRLRHRLVPWLNASPRKMSLELVLP